MTRRNAQHSTLNTQRSSIFIFGVRRSRPTPNSSFLIPNSARIRAAAFTLIETALAMLAIGLGLLAIFGLGRLGLQSSKETEHDQRCAMMADAVFETLREYNTRFVENARTNTISTLNLWQQQWNAVREHTLSIPFPPVADMSQSTDLYLSVNTGSLEAAYDADALSLSEWNPRYELVIGDGNHSHVANGVNAMNVSLAIYPDGDTYSSEYRLFRTTLTNPGGLP